ncbi:hypothetical protein BCR41DRAFT_346574, partial [Lobosporangium transversale]
MNLSIFDIQLLKDEVTQYLSQDDLTRCVLVSKDWFGWFAPVLWRNVQIDGAFGFVEKRLAGLKRHSDNVQTLIILEKQATMHQHIPLHNLKSFIFYPDLASSFEESYFLQYIQTIPSLQTLTLTISLARTWTQTQLFETLERLPRLKELNLTCYQITHPIVIQQLIQRCRQYDILRLSLGGGGGLLLDTQQANLEAQAKAFMEYMQENQIRELSIRLPLPHHEDLILIPLLKRCPMLERLDLQWLHHKESLQHIVGILETRRCSHLRHVRIGGGTVWNSDDPIAGLFRALRRFEHTKANSHNINEMKSRLQATANEYHDEAGSTLASVGLKSFIVDATVPFGHECVLALTQYHALTLTVLDLMSLRQLPVQFFVGLVSSLPKLRSLMVAVWIKFIADDELLGPESMFMTSWACLELRYLELGIVMSPEVTSGNTHQSGDGSLADQHLSYIFSQLGRLEGLKDWKLASSINLLTLEKGYLRWLPRLKQLRSLDLRRYSFLEIGAAEARWMIDNWTSLVHLDFNYLKGVHRGLEGGPLPEDASQLLLTRRPWMTI